MEPEDKKIKGKSNKNWICLEAMVSLVCNL